MIQSCEELLEAYCQQRPAQCGRKLSFVGVEGYDVYNITAPFVCEGKIFLAGRVEPRDSERSRVMFFQPVGDEDIWEATGPVFDLQDPFVTWIHGELVFGGVEVFPHPQDSDSLWWRTRFYRGTKPADLEPFAQGPDGMKDIRLAAWEGGQTAVFTRPQGRIGGRGKIGFTILNGLDELTPQALERAVLLEQFRQDEWGGANEVHHLQHGWLGVLGHIACFGKQGARHYYAMVFCFHPPTRRHTPMKIIAVRDDFPAGDAKRWDLKDVIFSGGLVRGQDDTAVLYAGVSDAEAHCLPMRDPFSDMTGDMR